MITGLIPESGMENAQPADDRDPVHPSWWRPTVGEPGVPPIAPAVANAYFRLTGQRVRNLPFFPNAGGYGDG